MRWHVEFDTGSSFFACLEYIHTGQTCSADEQHRAKALVLSVDGVAPHFELASFWMMQFLVFIFAFIIFKCTLSFKLKAQGNAQVNWVW